MIYNVKIFDRQKVTQTMQSENERKLLQYKKMTETPVPKLVLKLAIPTTISMVISSIYNMADTYFVACLDDTSATAAVSVVFALMAIIQAVGFTIGMGAGSWISRLLGEQKNEKASSVGTSAVVFGISFGLLIMIFGRIFVGPLMLLLGATDTILPHAVSYGQYILTFCRTRHGAFVHPQQYSPRRGQGDLFDDRHWSWRTFEYGS